MIKQRSEEQLAVAKKLGRRSVDTFKAGDLVVAQNARTGKWTIRGRITKTRTAEDGTTRSFEVKTDAGKTTLRNARHLRHQTKKMQVKWAVNVDTQSDDEVEFDTSSSRPGSSLVTQPSRTSERLESLRNRF